MDARKTNKQWLVPMAIVAASLTATAAGGGDDAMAAQPEVIESTRVDLPLLIAPAEDPEEDSEDQPVERAVAVATIPSRQFELSLDQPVSGDEARPKFELSRSPSARDNQEWDVLLFEKRPVEGQKIDALRSKAGLPVGKFYTQSGELMFTWIDADLPSHAQQLRNCVLSIKQGENVQQVALRSCMFVEPVKLDLELLSQKIELPELALPSAGSLFLQVLHVENFRVSTEQQPSEGVVPANKFARIQLVDWKFPAEVRTKLGKSRGKMVAIVMANYKLDKRWRPMTIKQVDRTMSDLRESLQENRNDNRRYMAGLIELPGKISRLQWGIRNSNNAFKRSDLARQLTKAKRYLSKAKGGARRTSNMIPELEARIHHLKALQQLGNKIHKQGTIHFRVGIRTENGEVELLRTTNSPERLAANN